MVGTFDLKLIRPNEGVIKTVVQKNDIDTSNVGLMAKIIGNLSASSGNAGIYLNPNFSYNSYTSNESSSHAVVGQDGIIATSPVTLGSYSGQGGETESDTTICFNVSQTEDEATATKARWKAQVQWINSEFEATIPSLEGGSNYITDFELGSSLSAYLDGFEISFASITLTGSDRVQPALNDIIDITWTIEVS
jgi:hypothetical protein|tara:strand:+ start:3510 stop:4088 length:579 start_codon:yes stop_codon:yes gene_type:complete